MAEDKKKNNGDQYSLEEILNEDFDSDETFTLESILAEFKSQAYMDGDKKTPKEILQKQTDEIIKEALKESSPQRSSTAASADESSAEFEIESTDSTVPGNLNQEKRDRRSDKERTEELIIEQDNGRADGAFEETENSISRAHKISLKEHAEAERKTSGGSLDDMKSVEDFFKDFTEGKPVEEHNNDISADKESLEYQHAPKIEEEKPLRQAHDQSRGKDNANDNGLSGKSVDNDLSFFEDFQFADRDISKYEQDVDETIERGKEKEDRVSADGPVLETFFRRKKHSEDSGEQQGDEYDFENEDDNDFYFEDEDLIDDDQEPQDLRPEALRFGSKVRSLRLRSFGIAVICVIMLVITELFAAGKSIPLGIGTSAGLTTGVLLILQLITMAAGIDILISGVEDIIKARPGIESLTVLSCLLSCIDGFVMLISGDYTKGIPFSLISSCSLFFTLWARKSYYMAMCDSIKTSMASSSPYGAISESKSVDGRFILKKLQGVTKGFYSRLIEADFSESAYAKAAPLFMLLALVFGVLTSVGRGRSGDIAHTLSIMTAVSAAFPAAAAFALPFRYASVRAKKSGSAIAGWGGASEIYYADGALLTDEDIFPVGSVSLSGLKLFEGVSQRKAIVYTSSIIIASGSELRRVFEELLKSQEFSAVNAEDFSSYDGGGLGAIVSGERVLVGTGAFMNLMGIRVPDSVNEKNNVFTAINGELAAVFTINYVPANSVRSALVSLLNTKTNILLAARDFNITPNAIQQKFKVSMEGVEFIPVETVYKLSDNVMPEGTGVSAVLCRGGLAPFAEVITRGRLLKTVTELNTLISIAGSVIGLLIMLFLCWNASFSSASAANVFLFMLAIEFCVILVSQVVRKRL